MGIGNYLAQDWTTVSIQQKCRDICSTITCKWTGSEAIGVETYVTFIVSSLTKLALLIS